MNNSVLARNLRAAMAERGLNQLSLAKAAGLKADAVRDVLRAKSASPRGQTLKALASFLEVNVGDLLAVDGIRVGVGDATEPLAVARFKASGGRTIQEYDVNPHAGGGAILPDLDGPESHPVIGQWTIPADLIQPHLTPAMRPVIIRVVGDSMEPDFTSGDRVMVDTAARLPSPPGIYVLWDGVGVIVKRCEVMMGSDPPLVRISSANPAYETYTRPLADVIINGRVMGKWSWK